jgi:hypothetical protein
MDSKKTLEKLASKNLFLCSNGENKMCLKNSNDEIVVSFSLIPKIDTLTCLKMQLDKLRSFLD